jgi:sulfopropanediol 3-dehydrogenase
MITVEQAQKRIRNRKEPDQTFQGRVAHIIETVRTQGDAGVRGIALALNDPPPKEIKLETAVTKERRKTLEEAHANIRRFAEETAKAAKPITVNYKSHTAGLRWQPVTTAGCYVPGGRFPLASSALMTVAAAKAAGVKHIVVCSPDSRPEVTAACKIAGAARLFRTGGAQAIAAMAYGTQTIPRADVIAGPGNAWVTEAKRQVAHITGIDMLAGPSEIALIVDEATNTQKAVTDLKAQAEHDPDSTSWCISTSRAKLEEIEAETKKEQEENQFRFVLANTQEQIAKFTNELAPEHLQLSTENPEETREMFTNYGALFLGENTPVPLGDYAAGPNHTLPTSGAARYTGGLTPFTFLRPQAWVRNQGTELPELAAKLANMEGLKEHEEACTKRA